MSHTTEVYCHCCEIFVCFWQNLVVMATSLRTMQTKRTVFGGLPEPNRACLVGVCALLIWNNLCDMVYQTPTKSYQFQIPVAFGIPGHVTTKHLPDTPC